MVINTTAGPQRIDTTDHVVNTSDVLEPPQMQYLDEPPEILAVLPANGWTALVGGDAVPLVAWVAMDTAKMYGVTIGEDGRIDLTGGNIENHPGFTRYTNTTDKENGNG